MKGLALLLILLFLTSPAISQQDSPYKKCIAADYGIYAAAVTVELGALYFDHNLEPLSEAEINHLERSDVNRFDRTATFKYSEGAGNYSDWGLRTCLALPFAFALNQRMRHDGTTIALLYFETMAVTGALTEFAKVTIRRTRPYAYNPDVPMDSKFALDTRKSFFSGHTSTSFAGAVFFAKVFNDYFPESRWRSVVWAGSLTAAASVGIARIKAGKHFPSDVIAAALVGSATGYLIPALHRSNKSIGIGASAKAMMLNLSFSW